jgi:hypothetical protein
MGSTRTRLITAGPSDEYWECTGWHEQMDHAIECPVAPQRVARMDDRKVPERESGMSCYVTWRSGFTIFCSSTGYM